MNKRKVCETEQELRNPQGFYSGAAGSFGIGQDLRPVADSSLMQLDGSERLRLAVDGLQIGRRIQDELKRQGRTVTWLAGQLGVERTSLYYTFRQNSIDIELMLRISFYLQHDFLHDVGNLFRSYGL